MRLAVVLRVGLEDLRSAGHSLVQHPPQGLVLVPAGKSAARARERLALVVTDSLHAEVLTATPAQFYVSPNVLALRQNVWAQLLVLEPAALMPWFLMGGFRWQELQMTPVRSHAG